MSAIGRATHTTKWIAVKDLSIRWAEAQRHKHDPKWVDYIAANLDPDLFGILAVTLPNGDGIHHVADGIHRTLAIKQLWGENEKVPCNVFDVDDPARAAELFDALNTARKNPSPLDIFKVRVVAKREPEFSVSKVLTELGYKIDNSGSDGAIRAVGACVSVFKRYKDNALVETMLLIRGVWGMEKSSTDSMIIRGFAAFLHRYGEEADRQRFVDKVGKAYTPGRFIGAIRSLKESYRGDSSATAAMRALVNTYNSGLRKGRLGE